MIYPKNKKQINENIMAPRLFIKNKVKFNKKLLEEFSKSMNDICQDVC